MQDSGQNGLIQPERHLCIIALMDALSINVDHRCTHPLSLRPDFTVVKIVSRLTGLPRKSSRMAKEVA
jgi:hypothetical protein